MSDSVSTSCDLCASPARIFATPNYGRYNAVACDNCGEYVISHAAASRLAGLPRQFKDALREQVREAAAEQILQVIVEPVGSGSNLKSQMVLRSSLTLQ